MLYREAFDFIYRNKIWGNLTNKNVDVQLLGSIESIYHETDNRVKRQRVIDRAVC